jgi:PAS domain S-box-containing protein
MEELKSFGEYALIAVDLDGKIKSWEEGAKDMFGYTKEEVIGKGHQILYSKTIRQAENLKHELEKASRLKKYISSSWFFRKDGTRFWGNGSTSVLKSDNDEMVGFVKIIRNATDERLSRDRLNVQVEMKKAAAQLGKKALSKTNLEELMSVALSDLASVLGVEYSRILEVHPDRKRFSLKSHFGFDADYSEGSPVVQAGKQSQEGYAFRSRNLIVSDDLEVDDRFRDEHLLKSYPIRSGASAVIFAEKGRPYGVVSVYSARGKKFSEDDAEHLQSVANIIGLAVRQTRTETRLRYTQMVFDSFVNANIIGVMMTDVNGTLIEANDAFLNMVNCSLKDVKNGRINVKQLVAPEYQNKERSIALQLLQRGYVETHEKEFVNQDTGIRVPVLAGGIAVEGNSTEIVNFVLDISERKKLEQRKDQFLGIASHELKTPLTSIKAYVQLLDRLIDDSVCDGQAKTYILRTNLYVDRLNRIISELLDVSRIQSGGLRLNYDIFDFRAMVLDVISSIQPISSHHEVALNGYDAKILVRGDSTRLEQVVTNLLSNAIKYSPDARKVDINISKKRGHVIFSVTDHGIGISKKDQGFIFTRFFRVEKTAPKYSGLGLGLYISRQIIRRHGGDMWLKSSEGQGSTFYCSLPLNYNQ